MSKRQCCFCFEDVDPEDPKVYQRVLAWVKGPKKDGATLRTRIDVFACGRCIGRIKAGQAPDQDDLFADETEALINQEQYLEGFEAGHRGDELVAEKSASYMAGYEAGQVSRDVLEF